MTKFPKHYQIRFPNTHSCQWLSFESSEEFIIKYDELKSQGVEFTTHQGTGIVSAEGRSVVWSSTIGESEIENLRKE